MRGESSFGDGLPGRSHVFEAPTAHISRRQSAAGNAPSRLLSAVAAGACDRNPEHPMGFDASISIASDDAAPRSRIDPRRRRRCGGDRRPTQAIPSEIAQLSSIAEATCHHPRGRYRKSPGASTASIVGVVSRVIAEKS